MRSSERRTRPLSTYISAPSCSLSVLATRVSPAVVALVRISIVTPCQISSEHNSRIVVGVVLRRRRTSAPSAIERQGEQELRLPSLYGRRFLIRVASAVCRLRLNVHRPVASRRLLVVSRLQPQPLSVLLIACRQRCQVGCARAFVSQPWVEQCS